MIQKGPAGRWLRWLGAALRESRFGFLAHHAAIRAPLLADAADGLAHAYGQGSDGLEPLQSLSLIHI